MSPWSGESPSANRGAVEPLAALVGVLAVSAGLSLYVVALDAATPTPESHAADLELDRVEREVTVGGVVRPERLRAIEREVPITVELETKQRRWRVGVGGATPKAGGTLDPRKAALAERSVSVAVAPGETSRGTLRVAVHQ